MSKPDEPITVRTISPAFKETDLNIASKVSRRFFHPQIRRYHRFNPPIDATASACKNLLNSKSVYIYPSLKTIPDEIIQRSEQLLSEFHQSPPVSQVLYQNVDMTSISDQSFFVDLIREGLPAMSAACFLRAIDPSQWVFRVLIRKGDGEIHIDQYKDYTMILPLSNSGQTLFFSSQDQQLASIQKKCGQCFMFKGSTRHQGLGSTQILVGHLSELDLG